MGAYFINLPRTEAALKLQNLEEMEKEYRFVYRIADDGKTAKLYDLYDENMLLNDADYMIMPFSSTFIKVCKMKKDSSFVNVIGSSGDRPTGWYSGYSWIDFYDAVVWEKCHIRVNSCVTKNRIYIGKEMICCECNDSFCPYCDNRKNLIGGHVIISPELDCAHRPSQVYGTPIIGILPICSKHNMFTKGYMALNQDTFIPIIEYNLSRELFGKELEAVRNQINP